MASDEKDTAEKNKQGGKSNIVLVLVVILVLLVVGGGGFFAYKMFLAPAANQGAGADDVVDTVNAEDPLGVTQKKSAEAGIMYEVPPFVVNLADPAGTKYLRIALSFELPSLNKKLPLEIDARLPKIKDTIITTLSAKTLEEIATSQGKISLKQELLRRVNGILTSGKVMDIYLTEFVVQA